MPNNTEAPEAHDEITTKLTKLRAEAESLREHVLDLEATLRSARGTSPDLSDLAAQAALAPMPPAALAVEYTPPPTPVPMSLRKKIELALARESLSAEALVRAVGEPTGKVIEMLKALRQEHAIHNLGSAEHPVWTWRIGDLTSTPVLQQMVRRLIMERPLTTRELAEATGARLSRVGGAMIALQRGSDRVLNLGTAAAGRWFIVGERAHDANLSTRPPIRRRRRRAAPPHV